MSHSIRCIVGPTVSIPILITTLAGTAVAQPAVSGALCWRSLGVDSAPQHQGLVFTYPTLAATNSNEAWLSWHDEQPHIGRWVEGQWNTVAVPTRESFDEMWQPMIAASHAGHVVLAAWANDAAGRSALHVARLGNDSWEWLGGPLISSSEPFTHVEQASIVFLDGDRTVVAWSEERNVRLGGLFVAAWDGSSWKRLGSLTPSGDDYFLSPSLAVDDRQQVWLAWNEEPGGMRVVRWDGSTWHDVGRNALQTLSASQGRTALRQLSLAVDSKGRVWLLRIVDREPRGTGLAIARWDGVSWTEISVPRGPAGKDSTVWSATMILRNDIPIVAWSQADASDNHYLFVSELEGDGWMARLSGLHVIEGVSNVGDVRLAAGDRNSLFVAWDEPGTDRRRTRLVHAYPCAPGETPASPPKSTVERDTWPTTVDEAARQIVQRLDDQSKTRVRTTRREQLIQYYGGWGMGIRNGLGLWRGNERLLESCGQGKRLDAEACSMVIIEAVWSLLQTPPKP